MAGKESRPRDGMGTEGRLSSRPPPPPPAEVQRRIPRSALWLVPLAVAVVEIVGHVVIRARVPEEADWREAATFVEAELANEDLVVSAPDWTDPLLREVLGDRIPLSEAGPSDTAPYERLWALTIRGWDPVEAPDAQPALDREFGRVRVRRWDLGESPVTYDFTEHLREAEVSLVEDGRPKRCPWRHTGLARGGGLGAGAMTPASRYVCDPRRPWLWVGETVTEDLDLEPRHCIWQHPAGREPVQVRFPDVPLGERMILYGGIYYEHERMREGGPIHVTVQVDGADVGRMIHRDGDGWKRVEIDPRSATEGAAERGDVTIEVTAPNPHLRTFCWSATMRSGPRRVAREETP